MYATRESRWCCRSVLRWKKKPHLLLELWQSCNGIQIQYSLAFTRGLGVSKNLKCHHNASLRGEAKVKLRANLAVNADVLPFTLKALKNTFFSIPPPTFLAPDRYCT